MRPHSVRSRNGGGLAERSLELRLRRLPWCQVDPGSARTVLEEATFNRWAWPRTYSV